LISVQQSLSLNYPVSLVAIEDHIRAGRSRRQRYFVKPIGIIEYTLVCLKVYSGPRNSYTLIPEERGSTVTVGQPKREMQERYNSERASMTVQGECSGIALFWRLVRVEILESREQIAVGEDAGLRFICLRKRMRRTRKGRKESPSSHVLVM